MEALLSGVQQVRRHKVEHQAEQVVIVCNPGQQRSKIKQHSDLRTKLVAAEGEQRRVGACPWMRAHQPGQLPAEAK